MCWTWPPFIQLRTALQSWSAQISDARGCIDLAYPQRAVPMMVLSDATVPVLALLDDMHADGWVATAQAIVHSDLAKRFINRNIQSKRLYLQVLLTLRDRLVHNPNISSAQAQSYYTLIQMDTFAMPELGDTPSATRAVMLSQLICSQYLE